MNMATSEVIRYTFQKSDGTTVRTFRTNDEDFMYRVYLRDTERHGKLLVSSEPSESPMHPFAQPVAEQ